MTDHETSPDYHDENEQYRIPWLNLMENGIGGTINSICKTFIIGSDCHERFLALSAAPATALRETDVATAGLSELRGSYRIGRPDFREHVVVWTLAGRGRWRFTDGICETRAGDRVIVPAHLPYACELSGRLWRIAWVHLAATPAWEHLESGKQRHDTATESGGGTVIAEAMSGLLRESREDAVADDSAARAYAELLAVLLRREIQPGPHSADREVRNRLRAVWDVAERDLAHSWTVQELATLAHLSAVQFHRLCVRHLGRSPMALLTRLRMRRAEALLRSTAWPLKQIAPLLGYRNEFAFSTAFKRHIGRSPAAWRKG